MTPCPRYPVSTRWHFRRSLFPFYLALLQIVWSFPARALEADRCRPSGPDQLPILARWSVGSGIPGQKFRKLRNRTSGPTVHDGHYVFGSSAIPIEGGGGYYQNISILMHSAYYAPFTGLTIGGGLQVGSLISSIATKSGGPIVHLRINGGARLARSQVYLGGFAMGARITASIPFENTEPIPRNIGLLAMQATFGGALLHVTTTLGWGTENGALTAGPLIGISGLWHITDLVCVLTENWQLPFVDREYRVFSYGVRFTHRKMAFDIAFANNKDLSDFFILGVPLVGFSLRF